MIPKNSTPIKNEILIDIFAKGLLNKDEMRIVFYIIRWSWGFDGKHRRQDYTKELTKRQIADDIGMAEQHIGKNINKMIGKNIIIVKNDCYQFNEHYEEWKNLPKRLVLKKDKKLTKKVSKTNQKGYKNSPNTLVKLTKKVSLGIPNNQGKGIKNKDIRGGEHTSKETLKETLKETIKKRGDIFVKAWEDFNEMRKKNNKNKPITLRAEEMILDKLDKLSGNTKEQIAILNESTMNDWKSVFPLKVNKEPEVSYQTYKSKKLSKTEMEKYKDTAKKGIKILMGGKERG